VEKERKGNVEIARDFFAGTVAGCSGIIVGHPFDTIKVHLQLSNSQQSVFSCLHKIVKNNGFRGLMKGIVPPLCTDAITNSVLFSANGVAQRSIRGDNVKTSMTPWEVFLCGSFAGIFCCFIATPVELVKIKLQMESQQQIKSYSGTLDCVKSIVRANGIQGLFRGFSSVVIRDVPAYGVYFMSYEWTKGVCNSLLGRPSEWFSIIAGGVAGCAAWACSYPADVIKSNIQFTTNGTSFIECARQLYRAHGSKVFFRGLTPTLVRSFPVNATIFGTYELISSLLR